MRSQNEINKRANNQFEKKVLVIMDEVERFTRTRLEDYSGVTYKVRVEISHVHPAEKYTFPYKITAEIDIVRKDTGAVLRHCYNFRTPRGLGKTLEAALLDYVWDLMVVCGPCLSIYQSISGAAFAESLTLIRNGCRYACEEETRRQDIMAMGYMMEEESTEDLNEKLANDQAEADAMREGQE